MHIIVTRNMFHDEFRSIRPDNFNRAGLDALFDYFDNADNFELDVIEICCDFSQYTVESTKRRHNPINGGDCEVRENAERFSGLQY